MYQPVVSTILNISLTFILKTFHNYILAAIQINPETLIFAAQNRSLGYKIFQRNLSLLVRADAADQAV
jgi:hypothetical protein